MNDFQIVFLNKSVDQTKAISFPSTPFSATPSTEVPLFEINIIENGQSSRASIAGAYI